MVWMMFVNYGLTGILILRFVTILIVSISYIPANIFKMLI